MPNNYITAPLFPMIAIQRKANLASDDQRGIKNSTYTMRNYIFIVIGSAYWAWFAYVTYLLASSTLH